MIYEQYDHLDKIEKAAIFLNQLKDSLNSRIVDFLSDKDRNLLKQAFLIERKLAPVSLVVEYYIEILMNHMVPIVLILNPLKTCMCTFILSCNPKLYQNSSHFSKRARSIILIPPMMIKIQRTFNIINPRKM